MRKEREKNAKGTQSRITKRNMIVLVETINEIASSAPKYYRMRSKRNAKRMQKERKVELQKGT